MEPLRYAGLSNDENGGMTHWGQMIRDAWVFGFLPETEDGVGWTDGQLQNLYEKIWEEWGKYAHLPSRLPGELQQRYMRIHQAAIERAKQEGWDPELGEDD